MSPDEITIKESLESEFDVPFDVIQSTDCHEPCYLITPSNPGKELFSFKIFFRNGIRLRMEFIPQSYSSPFIHEMGKKNLNARCIFSDYRDLMVKNGARCTIRVNNQELDFSNPHDWPDTWNAFDVKITKMPVCCEDTPDYIEIVKEWGSLAIGMVLSLTDVIPIEHEDQTPGYMEGDAYRIESIHYERNPLNRKLCLAANGYTCKICGFNFEKVYGPLGHNFIHVHHIVPVSQLGANYIINPYKDLIPVCPNCHAMLHRQVPPLSPKELKAILENSLQPL